MPFSRLIAGLSIAFGIVWTVNPSYFRDWFLRRTHLHLFGFVLGFLLYPLIHYGHRIGFWGVMAILAVFWVAVKWMHRTLQALFQKIPLIVFRVMGVLNVVAGIMLLKG